MDATDQIVNGTTPAAPQQAPSPRISRGSLLKNVCFSALVFVFVLIVLHLIAYFGIRYQNDRAIREMRESLKGTVPRFLDYLDLRLEFVHPFLKTTLAPDQHLPFCRINHQGHRGPDFVREKTGAFRIAILGGSAAMGWFANSEDETIHSRLQAELERTFPGDRFEVYNFANAQYNSTQELFVLETEALAYRPDFVILLSGINDFGWPVEEKPWRPHYPLGWFHVSTILNPDSFQEGWQGRPWPLRWSFKWSFLARTAWQNVQTRCSPSRFLRNLLAPRKTERLFAFGEADYAAIGRRTELWARNVERMARLLRSFGIPYCASLQPFAYYHHQPTDAELQVVKFYIRGEADLENARRYWNTVYPAAEKALAARPFAIDTLELARCFEDVRETVFFDPCHFNARGTELLAQRYADHLRPRVEQWRERK